MKYGKDIALASCKIVRNCCLQNIAFSELHILPVSWVPSQGVLVELFMLTCTRVLPFKQLEQVFLKFLLLQAFRILTQTIAALKHKKGVLVALLFVRFPLVCLLKKLSLSDGDFISLPSVGMGVLC